MKPEVRMKKEETGYPSSFLHLPSSFVLQTSQQEISNLDSFAETFLVKCTLGQMISRYMVLIASEQKLMMMRPYQIYAVKQIVDCIHHNSGNGYIWHTTGSGKTLTSFKASTLLKDNHRQETVAAIGHLCRMNLAVHGHEDKIGHHILN
jgi:type I site-specific restriction-modification system R (restriction) subunit